ncbi:hypothetical protein [Nocardia nova]|uniref:hypothetical protein n=1 Tax=Nocardia nova TaxID=37330 RepID=UPI0018950099|nr:hypothetical protein [Nocardia nova]MBF6150283.1 hypothetical protein [Nocardia nova]
MTWLAEMKAAPMNVVAELLGSSETNAYRVVSRWRAGGLVMQKALRPVPGPQWVVPTPEIASAMLGFYVGPWVPGPKDARHLELTARVRLALAGREIGEDSWVSERILRRADTQKVGFGQERPHLHDGHWTDDQGHLHAIEVELTRKSSTHARKSVAAAYAEAKAVGAQSLRYYVADINTGNRVWAAAKAVLRPPRGDEPEFEVQNLDDLLTPQTTGSVTRLFAAGGAA